MNSIGFDPTPIVGRYMLRRSSASLAVSPVSGFPT